ncbi:MAG: SDR family NAD(P)-dependent oxidoreductase [Pseudomonadota bacterium]
MVQGQTVDPPSTVFVTGASGYIAKHICLKLLDEGYRVVGSVRTPARAQETLNAIRAHLDEDADSDDRLRLVTLDLDDDAGWSDAMLGADALIHTASPLPLEQPDDPREIVRTAVDGAVRAMRAAQAAGVGRVVMTSSTAAIMSQDLPDGLEVYDETVWSDPEYPSITPYAKSKTLAERAAWDVVAREAPGLKLTVINPSFVLGAPLDDHLSASIKVVQRLLRGKHPALPDLGFTCVDVGDIADMHVRALTTPASVGQRIIGADRFVHLVQMAKILAAAYPDRRIATRQAPDWLIRLIGLFDRPVRSIIPRLGERDEVSNALAKELLDIDFSDVRHSIRTSADFLVARGLVK